MVPSLFEARNGLKFEIHCGIGFCHFKLFSVSTICKFRNSKFSFNSNGMENWIRTKTE